MSTGTLNRLVRGAASFMQIEAITDAVGLTKDPIEDTLIEILRNRIVNRNIKLSSILAIISTIITGWYLHTNYNFFCDLSWWAWILVVLSCILGPILIYCILFNILNWVTADFSE